MSFNRSRYVTLCQQSLVGAAVLALGLSAAGVKTLDIVPSPAPLTGAGTTTLAQEPPRAEVDVAPVNPRVTEVAVNGVAPTAVSAGERAKALRKAAPSTTARWPAARTPSTTPSGAPTTSPSTATTATPESTTPTAPPVQAPAPDSTTQTAPPARIDGMPVVAESAPTPVHGYATVGVTWSADNNLAEDQVSVQVRTEKDGVWSDWMAADYHDDHGPDEGTGEAAAQARPGTDAVVIGNVDQVQMRAAVQDGQAPADLKLAVIDPGVGTLHKQAPAIDTASLPSAGTPATGTPTPGAAALSAATTEGAGEAVSLAAMKAAPKPMIYSRAQWGANEKLREQTAPSYGTVKTGFIHHTVNANNYTEAQVPALLRGIYAYHTQSRKWRDIGYNYLVDRFGRIWEGRWGGVDRAVVGAHTSGYNEVSFAMSAIGNFDIAQPPQQVMDAFAALFAWKLSLYDIRADAPRLLIKNGKYLPAINGHRDVGSTACPGKFLYAHLPAIRVATQRLQDAAQGAAPTTPPPTPPPTTPPTPPAGYVKPTTAPRAAINQPGNIAFPKAVSLTGSGYPDVVVKAPDGAISVLPTTGQTGFGAPVSTPGGWAAMNLIAAAGDLTGDGHGDVLARTARDRVTRIYPGDGRGRVSTRGIAPTKVLSKVDMVFPAGDWNGDRRADILARNGKSGRLYLIRGLGGGRMAKPKLLSKTWRAYRSAAVVGDLTGDGRADIVALGKNGRLYVIPKTAKNTLAKPIARQYVGGNFDAVLGGVTDLTGDRWADALLRNPRAGTLDLLSGIGGANFGAGYGPFGGFAGLRWPSAANMSGTGHADVVGTNAAGTALLVYPHNGRTNTGALVRSNLTVPGATAVYNVGDWNRDGRADVITREGGGDTLVLRPGLGNGNFGAGVLMGDGWSTVSQLAPVGDVTGDGAPDLAGRIGNGKLVVFPGNGQTSFQAPALAPAALRTFNQIGTAAWQTAQMPSSAFGVHNGTFAPYGGIGAVWGEYDWLIAAGDVDGDGLADLILRGTGTGLLWLAPGTPTGLGPRRLLATGFAGYQLGG